MKVRCNKWKACTDGINCEHKEWHDHDNYDCNIECYGNLNSKCLPIKPKPKKNSGRWPDVHKERDQSLLGRTGKHLTGRKDGHFKELEEKVEGLIVDFRDKVVELSSCSLCSDDLIPKAVRQIMKLINSKEE